MSEKVLYEKDWQNYKSKPVTIKAKRVFEDFEVQTLEGLMKGKAGDWLIEGTEGEHYPCKDSVFRRKYGLIKSKLVPVVGLAELKKYCEERLKRHKREKGPDGFFVCDNEQEARTEVASKEEWFGDEKSRKESIAWHKKMRKEQLCSFCKQIDDLLSWAESRSKGETRK